MDELLLQHTLVNDEEEELKMVAATLVAGVELARIDRIESRNPSRCWNIQASVLVSASCSTHGT
jgi:hypothetical protein